MMPDFIIFSYDRGLFFYYLIFLLPILVLISVSLFFISIRISLIAFFLTFFAFCAVTAKPIGYKQCRDYSIEEFYSEGLISKKTFDHFYPEVMKERLEKEKEAKEIKEKQIEKQKMREERLKEIEKQKMRKERLKEIEKAEKEFKG
ncbi:hypothetical protein CQA57_06960 [Helicobacter anseris]|uniref:Uncharacterized protein n=1 Tax=Helicobacter anseris TaxID=375926 RepID=A0A3D8J5B3_9HELI|nr:hypothetical protein [Helicobacter anseris]RDU72335.1 hypothetical protein CQA57_06960 [Helicobacter anseris]